MQFIEAIRRFMNRGRQVEQTSWSVGVYYSSDLVVLHSQSRTISGVGWYNQPVWTLARDESPEKFGAVIRNALQASTWYSEEDDSMDKLDHILEASQAKNNKDLYQRFEFLTISSEGGEIHFYCLRKTKKKGEGRGYIANHGDNLPEDHFPDDVELEELGQRFKDLIGLYEQGLDRL
jgi:hypothetical protein